MSTEKSSKRVCIIGAGVSGLIAIKRVRESEGLEGTVFEQMDRIGGLWHYVEDTEKDANNLPVHSAVYHGLRYNVSLFAARTRLDTIYYKYCFQSQYSKGNF